MTREETVKELAERSGIPEEEVNKTHVIPSPGKKKKSNIIFAISNGKRKEKANE